MYECVYPYMFMCIMFTHPSVRIWTVSIGWALRIKLPWTLVYRRLFESLNSDCFGYKLRLEPFEVPLWLYVLYSSETFGFEWMSSLSLQQLKVEENVDRQATKHHRGSVVKRTCSYRGPGPRWRVWLAAGTEWGSPIKAASWRSWLSFLPMLSLSWPSFQLRFPTAGMVYHLAVFNRGMLCCSLSLLS